MFLGAWAPVGRVAYSGKLLGARYELRRRRTSIYFETESGVQVGEFDHNTGLVSQPAAGEMPVIAEASPRIRLRFEAGMLVAKDERRKIFQLMELDREPLIVYPNPVHPELTVLWTAGGDMYFTNNDYHNVYQLPGRMWSSWSKPRLSVGIGK